MHRLCNIVLFLAAALCCSGCNYHKVIEEPSLGEYFRAPSATSNIYADKVYEYTPAPGQFINDPVSNPYGTKTEAAALVWAKERLDEGKFVSLGGFGGYIVVGFDHSIVNLGGYTFAVYGNAHSGGSEPGIVWVAQDANGNGLPDDIWYELRGSDSSDDNTLRNYSVTYYRPAGKGEAVRWSDSEGEEGTIDYLAAYHTQDSYYPDWITTSSYTLTGTRLKAHNYDQSGDGSYWVNPDYNWGYADNFGGSNFRIDDAMDAEGKPAGLKYIDFIKVQTAVNAKSGWLGELSTEVTGFEDLSINVKP
ncbi:MAG: hypothetical protein J6X89_01170 [Bacteroidales bacterium]|nr:hypothetical protein [Bacteroidales bacterium]